MAKRSRIWNQSTYERRIKKGSGTGEGSGYIPWITVQDFPSKGTINRIQGWKTNRTHHFMSNNELLYFYLLEWSDIVTDIREQYPMDIPVTLEIAKTAGIKHPYDKSSGFPYALTSDFLIQTNQGIIVRTVKTSTELSQKRVLEKLEIERRYWDNKGVDWKLVTEQEINQQKAKNIEWLHSSKTLQELPYDNTIILVLIDKIIEFYQNTSYSILDICNRVDVVHPVIQGTALTLFKYLVANKRLKFNICQQIDLAKQRK